jgi:hypothetical protein
VCPTRRFRWRVSATKLLNKSPLAILNGTSNPIGLHNEHSLFQRIKIHLHYDMKASKHLASLLTTDNMSASRLHNHLFLCSYGNSPPKKTAFHYRYDMQMYCTFVLFVNQHFPGLASSCHYRAERTSYGSCSFHRMQDKNNLKSSLHIF